MADNYQITLGLGTPANIGRFVLYGLTQKQVAALYVSLHERMIAVEVDDRDVGVTLHEE